LIVRKACESPTDTHINGHNPNGQFGGPKMTPVPKTVLYMRVSTAEQKIEHQLDQAREGGFEIKDHNAIADHGVSGV